jgi:hypothetical protein
MEKVKKGIDSLEKENLVINLIKDDLTNTYLISGLNKLGLDSGKYYLNLSSTIFSLMGFHEMNHDDPLLDEYYEEIGRGAEMDIFRNQDRMDSFAYFIYQKLLKIKEQQEGN